MAISGNSRLRKTVTVERFRTAWEKGEMNGNVGIGASGMKDYLDHVRSQYMSKTEWFDIDLPWGKRDAMEITTIKAKGDKNP